MALKTVLSLTLQAIHTATADLSTPTDSSSLSSSLTWESGTGANQADRVFHDNRTLAGTTAEDLDLAGVLTDKFGATITFARIKGIYIKAGSANGGNLQVGGDINSVPIFGATADYIIVRPGGSLLWLAPDATAVVVTPSTGDILQVENVDAAAATYDVVIIGASA